ncbi:MAG: HepT-like ribonuclease domain-containing protein [bacterium]
MTKLNIESIQDKVFRLKANADFITDIIKLSDEDILNGSDISKYIALEHMLQLSIQIILDAGSHILAEDFHENPATYNEVILALGKHEVIPKDLAVANEEMAKFRNKLVHDYDNVDKTKVLEYARSAPEIFKAFGKAYVGYIERSPNLK